MKIRQLQALRALVLAGTTTEAAELLHLTQPAVSKLINQVEQEFNVRIFDRRHGRLVMTPEGRTLYADVERILAQIDDLAAKTEDVSALSGNAIRVGAMPALGFGLLPSALRRFAAAYPQVRCVIEVETRGRIEELVGTGHYELGFVTLPVQHERLTLTPLASVAAVCIVPPEHALARKASIRAEDLADEPFVSVDPNILLRHRVDAVFGQRRVKRRLQVQVSTTALVCNMVAASVGVSIVHPFVALAFKSLVAVRKFEPSIALEYAILSRPGTPSRVTAAFQEAAVAEMSRLTRSLDQDLRKSRKKAAPGRGAARWGSAKRDS
jgi:DNA-binding transcriptional LysR family regulator